jgi:hypothetical protein
LIVFLSTAAPYLINGIVLPKEAAGSYQLAVPTLPRARYSPVSAKSQEEEWDAYCSAVLRVGASSKRSSRSRERYLLTRLEKAWAIAATSLVLQQLGITHLILCGITTDV